MSAIHRKDNERPHLITVSAPSADLLARHAGQLAQYLERHRPPLTAVAATLQRRSAHAVRFGTVVRDSAELVHQLRAIATGEAAHAPIAGDQPKLVFAFTGQGSQYAGMGVALLDEPVFADWFGQAQEILAEFDVDLEATIRGAQPDALLSTRTTAPAIHTVSVGILAVLQDWGVRPHSVLGHSLGEYAAAVAAGVLEPVESLRLVAERSRLMHGSAQYGAMAAVRLGVQDAALLLAEFPALDLAAVNSPKDVVFSGPVTAIDDLLDTIRGRYRASRLNVTQAFHSRMMTPAATGFANVTAPLGLRTPTLPFLRCEPDGTQLEEFAPVSPEYWVRQMTDTVRYDRLVDRLATGSQRVLVVEVGPQPMVTRYHQAAGLDGQWTLDRAGTGDTALLASLGQLWSAGVVGRVNASGQAPASRLPATPLSRPDSGRQAVELAGPQSSAAARTAPSAPTAKVDSPPVPQAQRPAAGASRALLEQIWVSAVGSRPVPGQGLISSGADSLTVLRMRQKIAAHWGSVPTVDEFFDDPTLEEIAQMLAAPDENNASEKVPLAGAHGTDEFPVSRMQSALLTARAVGEPQENVIVDAEVGSVLDASRLSAAFDALQEQVEVLRTRFTVGRHGWQATASDQPQTRLRVVRAGSDMDATASQELATLMEPLLPEASLAACAVMGEDRTRLLVACHHAIADARSMGLLLQRWAALYGSGTDAAGGEPDNRHRVLVEAGKLGTPGTRGQTSRFGPGRRRLGFDRGPEASGPAREVTRRLDSTTTQRLRALCAKERATLPMVVLSALVSTLRIYDPDREVVVGMPVDIRHALLEPDACGPLIDVLALNWPQQQGESFLDVLKVTRAETARALTIAGNGGDHAEQAFDVMFSVPETGAPGDFAGHGLTLRDIPVSRAKFPLTVALLHNTDGVTLAFEYDSGRVPPPVVEALAECVLRILTKAAHDPSVPVGMVGGVPLDAQPVRTDEPVDRAPALAPMLATLLRSLTARGDEPVLRVGTDRLVGGRRLSDRISRIAAALGARGIGPGSLVALLLPADEDAVVAVQAVLAAGAAYLPLDPAAPQERNRGVLGIARPDMILAMTADQEAAECTVDDLVAEGETVPAAELPVPTPEGALAYVIATSGTTGTPKNVAIPRSALASYLQWALNAYAENGPVNSALVSSLSVDLSVTSVFLPLLSGGELWLPGPGKPDDAVLRAADHPEARGLLKATPSHLEFLVGAGARALPWDRLVIGGEPLRGSLVRDLRSCRPDVRIINEYGPTEATVGCVVQEVPTGAGHGSHPADDQVPIGQPIAGCVVRVLDEWSHPVPLGAVGELYVGGPGLAWGYRDDPRATATAFVPDPLGSGTRLYRTGDLVRWDGDRLRFLRRATTRQVKVRGHRIELGEVGAALRRLPGVTAAHVLAEPTDDGATRLTAQVVGTLPQDAKSRLAAWLPAPAIPASIAVVDSLPVALGGKRGKISPPPEPAGRARAAAQAASRGDTTASAFASEDERAVASVWSQVLEQTVDQPEADFFALGGNSLTVLMAMAELRERFPQVEAQDFYARPTVAELAAYLGVAAQGDPSGRSVATELPSARFAVTGATGLLGARVVARLLAEGHTVLALARPLAGAGAEERVHRALREAGADEEMFGRLGVVGLDLSDPAASLPVGLCAAGGVLIHTAADIRHFGEPEEFRRINVDGTRKVAGWALRDGLALLHVSSSGLADLEELDETEREAYLVSPYVRSKWQAEYVVRGHAESDGLPCRIVRVGSLVGDSRTGSFPQDPGRNRVYRVLQAILTAGAAPSAHQWGLDLLPADVAAEAVAALAAAPMSDRVDTVHVVNPVPLPFAELAAQFRDLGYDIVDSDVDAIVTRLRRDSRRSAKEAAATLAAWVGDPEAKQPVPDLTRMTDLLPGLRVPPPDRRLLAVLVEEMVRTGFLPAPRTTPQTADA